MKYSDVVKLGEGIGVHIEPHVIPLWLAWRVADYTYIEVVRDITWSAVSAQTSLMLTDRELAQLESLSSDNQLEFLVKELGYKGVLIVVTSTKHVGKPGYYRYSNAYAYLANPDPEWSEIGIAVGLLVERVIASWQEAS